MFYADLHIHSKFSRATSRDADLEHMALWARKKGVSVLGTGDFTHPAWFAEIKEKLVPAEPGLFRLRADLQREVDQQLPGACQGPVRFMLEVEISTIYKKGDRTRKVHHLIYAPDLEKAQRLIDQLSRIGNLKSDGRPILGLDSRDLLEITLQSGDGCYLVPAHIWTPWFAVLGSKSGFDAVEECYGDLSGEIFALETGLSSDPPMNWRLSSLDRYQLVSNSDAHSPPKIGREACAFDTQMDYFAMRRALENGQGYEGTVEFFPEEGKYHMDGHRKCETRLSPSKTREHDGLCPVCGKAVTVGVLHRIDQLADRPDDFRPVQTNPFHHLVPLPEVIAEIRGVGEKSKKVQQAYEQLIAKVGSELFILQQAPIEDLRHAGTPVVAEAVTRMRQGHVIREPGYDGVYGRIRLFEKDELRRGACVSMLFDMKEPAQETKPCKDQSPKIDGDRPQPPRSSRADRNAGRSAPAGRTEPLFDVERTDAPLDCLDADQRTAAENIRGPLLIVAGPGTGKTRTLTQRIAHLVADHDVLPEQCLAITFSRRAAGEMTERLVKLLPRVGHRVAVMTFHALGLAILRDHAGRGNLPMHLRVAGEGERKQLLREALKTTDRNASRLLKEFSRIKRSRTQLEPDSDAAQSLAVYDRQMRERALVDFDDLIDLPTRLLESDAEIATAYREKWLWISVDEFQDIDEGQYRLVNQLVGPEANLCVIGDPDQSIYGFRGANAHLFQRFEHDFPAVRTVHLTRNYRSSRTIVSAAMQVITPSSLVTERVLEALSQNAQRIEIQSSPSERAEAEYVVHTIERLIGGTTLFSLDSGRVESGEGGDHSFSDFAVLYRTDAQAEPLVEAFARSGMPFQRKSHGSLIDQEVVAAMARHIQDLSQLSEASAQTSRVVDLLKQAADCVWDEYPDAATYLTQLHPLAQRCGEDSARFLAELSMGVDVDLWDSRADRVSLLTLHAAKGLEFAVVFIVGCEDGLLPLRWGKNETDIAEERRLVFVGMTRARDRLYLSHARKRLWRGKVREMKASPLLQEIEEELLHRAARTSKRKQREKRETQLELFKPM